MTVDLENESNRLLLLLLFADLIFILMHVCYLMHVTTDPLCSIERDRGYAEVYQYVKETWIVLLLIMVAAKRGQFVYFFWSLLFVYLLLDDSLRIHETVGRYLVSNFDLQPMLRLRAQDYGELGASMFFGLMLFALIGVSYLFSDPVARQVSKHLFWLVMSVAFFGVFVDMLHTAIPWGKSIWGTIEDGGEMIIMSLIVWYAFHLKSSPQELPSLDHLNRAFIGGGKIPEAGHEM